MKKFIVLVISIYSVLLAGCVSVPMASLDEDQKAKSFAVDTGRSNIYVYRNDVLGSAVGIPVTLNGKPAGKTGPNTFFKWSVEPGKHKITSEAENTSVISVDAEAGKNYFIWQEIKYGLASARTRLQIVPDEEGRQGVKECSLIVSQVSNQSAVSNQSVTNEINSVEEKSVIEYYGEAEDEINTNSYDKNLWAKALVDAEGDEQKRKARYIELRANQLYSEKVGSISNLSRDEQPASTLSAQPTPGYDLTGTYASEVTRGTDYWFLNLKSSTPKVKIQQTGNNVKGTFGKGSGNFDGVIVGDTITIEWYTARGNGEAKWTMIPGSNQLVGSYSENGRWNLKKIQ